MKGSRKIEQLFIKKKNQLYHEIPQENYGRKNHSYHKVILIIIALHSLVNCYKVLCLLHFTILYYVLYNVLKVLMHEMEERQKDRKTRYRQDTDVMII